MSCRAKRRVSHTYPVAHTESSDVPEPVSLSFSQNAAAQSTSLPLPISTKVQRKNAKKAEAKKAAKAADEADRLRRLAMHKKELEGYVIDGRMYG